MGGCECGFHSHQEGKRWGHHELGAPPLWAAYSSPIKGGWGLPLYTHLSHLPSSPPAAPFHGLPLGEALTVGFFTAPRRCAAGFPGDPLLPLPRWIEGMEVVIKLYVWPITEMLSVHHHDLDIGKWTTTSSTRFDLVTFSVFEDEFF
jgi:hypothetical protein